MFVSKIRLKEHGGEKLFQGSCSKYINENADFLRNLYDKQFLKKLRVDAIYFTVQ